MSEVRILQQTIHHSDPHSWVVIYASRVETDQHDEPFEVLTRVGRSGYAEVVVSTVPLDNDQMERISNAVLAHEVEAVNQGRVALRAHERGL